MAEEQAGNPGYAQWQLARALRTASDHPAPEVRAAATGKAASWLQALAGMLSGALSIGGRTPVHQAPAWVTLKVLAGGFASGELLAGGPLLAHENALAERVGAPAERAALNAWFLTDDGLAALTGMLEAGTYRVDVPEEAALLVVAWLVRAGRAGEARALVDQLAEWFDRLRFYPRPEPRPLPARTTVHLDDVAATRARLARREVPVAIRRLREAVSVWTPMMDRLVALFAETVRDGWPCQVYPEGWPERAAALLAEEVAARDAHRLCRGPRNPRRNLARLLEVLQVVVQRPHTLTGRLVGRVRATLAQIAACRGLPGSERTAAARAHQARQVAGLRPQELARVLAARLAPLPQDDALDALEPLVAPVSVAEAEQAGVVVPGAARSASPSPVPDRLRAALARSVAAPLEELVARGVIRSGEQLARLAPRLTVLARGSAIADPAQRRLDGALYRAFRARRSLMLLNLESQVKLHELPWARPLVGARGGDASAVAARAALGQLAGAYLRAFPYVLTPNRLVTELAAMAREAGLALPLVRELAADIFTGELTVTFLEAARSAAALLRGSLYETYYRISYDTIGALPVPPRPAQGAPVSAALARLCHARAGIADPLVSGRNRPAANGAVIEQAQIVTTHNLAVLYAGLAPDVDPAALATRTLDWIAASLDGQPRIGHAALVQRKDMAYAWRQLVFFLSLTGRETWPAWCAAARERLARMRAEGHRTHFEACLGDLAGAMDGTPPPRPFLGWVAKGG